MVKHRNHFIDKIKIMKKEELWLRLKEMLSGTIGTQEYYFELHPDLKAERQALHDAIIQWKVCFYSQRYS